MAGLTERCRIKGEIVQFSDEGYIIRLLRHGENSLLVTVLSAQHGKITGFVKGALSKKKLGVYQLGNAISFNAYARLEENLPQFRGVELLHAHAVSFMADERKLATLSAFCELMNVCLPEKEALENLNFYIKGFMNGLEDENWAAKYALIEFHLLAFLGIGLDLSACAATGTTENLAFVSPKSGKAVCLEAGLPYRDKLFKFPYYAVDKNVTPSAAEVADLLNMTAYFLDKNFFQIHGLKFPNNRANLLQYLKLAEE